MKQKNLIGHAARFRLYYRTNYWGDPESRSGDSSRADRALVVTRLLQSLINCNVGLHILDVGCGDFNWARKLRFNNYARYTGIDIVPELIERNSQIFGESERVQFLVLDATNDLLPQADVVLVRDLLIHLNNSDVQLVLDAVANSQPSLFLSTSYRGFTGRRSIKNWGFAPIDLESELYKLGRADFFLAESPNFDRPEDGLKGLAGWHNEHMLKTDLNFLKTHEVTLEALHHLESSAPLTRINSIPDSYWQICSNGSGFSYFSFRNVGPNKLQKAYVEIRPLFASFTALDRRITKQHLHNQKCTIIGRQVIVEVTKVSDNCRGISPSDICIINDPVSFKTMNCNSQDEVIKEGFLCKSTHIHHSRLVKLPNASEHLTYLLVYPLSIALSTVPTIEALEHSGLSLNASIWGAGTAGLIMAHFLINRGWHVEISDLFPNDSLSHELATRIGAVYVQSNFDYQPKCKPLLSVDSSGDPGSTEAAICHTNECGKIIVWPELLGPETNLTDKRIMVIDSVNDFETRKAIELIGGSFGSLLNQLIVEVVPLWEFDRALFPMIPSCTVAVSTKCKNAYKPWKQ